MFSNRLNMGLPLRAWIENTVHEMKIHWLSGYKKVWVQRSVTRATLYVFSDMKEFVPIDFLEKCTFVKCASFVNSLGKISLYLLNNPSNPASLLGLKELSVCERDKVLGPRETSTPISVLLSYASICFFFCFLFFVFLFFCFFAIGRETCLYKSLLGHLCVGLAFDLSSTDSPTQKT